LTMSNENTLTRRGFLAKVGILFNGLVATALAVPVVRFLLSSVTRGRADGYLSWVSLGPIGGFPEGETRLGPVRHQLVMPGCRQTARQWTLLAGCGASKAIDSRFSRLTARTWAARYAGFPSPACSCVHVTAERTIAMAHAPRDRRSAGFSSIRTKSRTVTSL